MRAFRETRMNDVYNQSDEELWVSYMLVLASNPAQSENTVEEDCCNADVFLTEFKLRFRD